MSATKPSAEELRTFGAQLHDALGAAPFGALSKSELELAYFSALVDSGIVDPSQSNFALARHLRCTPTKAGNLVFNYRLRSTASDGEAALQKSLAEATKVVQDRANGKAGRVTLNIEDRFWRDALVNRLKELGAFTDTSFNRERLILDADVFIQHCPDLFGEDGEAVRQAATKAASKNRAEFVQAKLTAGTLRGAASVTVSALATILGA